MTTSVWIALLLLVSGGAEDRARRLRELASAESRAKETACALQGWVKAVQAHDTERLLEYQFEEMQPWIRELLQNPDSTLSRSLFGEEGSVESYLKGIRELQIAVFEQTPRYQGDLLVACMLDGTRRHPSWPDSYSRLMSLSDRRKLFCVDIQYAEEQWYISYGFGIEDGADDDPP